ncbi:MAG: TetR/AcrR family transcriptional regulator [Streptosporangiales bacterium]
MTTTRMPYTPESLLDIAVGVFNERGYDGTSMANLASAAGITKSAIYHHVRGKEDLLRLAVGRAVDALFELLDEPGATEGRAADRLDHVVRRTAETLVRELPYVTLLLRVRGNTGTERWALEQRREFDHRVAALVREAIEASEVRGDVDPRLATRLLFGMINSITEWYRPSGGNATGAEIGRAVSTIAFGGLRRT